jgi:hypothetical protein
VTPAAKEVWIAVDANGVPASLGDGSEGAARVTVKALDEALPQRGPHRVQKYVVEDRVEFVHEWYANRFERLRVWANTSLTESLRHQYFNIVANGTAEPGEPPTYAQLMNVKQHTVDRMAHHIAALHQLLGIRPSTQPRPEMEQHAERVLKDVMVASKENSLTNDAFESANEKLTADLEAAHATIRAMLTGVDRGNMAPVGEVMSALIGAMQTEDGLAVVRYCGHLERLLKAERAVTRLLAAMDLPDDDANPRLALGGHMSLRDDARWIEDALDSILFGALPLWPPKWTTVTGQRIAAMVQRLYKQRTDAMLATSMHEMEKARLLAEIDGLRATNEKLTNMLEPVDPERRCL